MTHIVDPISVNCPRSISESARTRPVSVASFAGGLLVILYLLLFTNYAIATIPFSLSHHKMKEPPPASDYNIVENRRKPEFWIRVIRLKYTVDHI